MKVGMSRQAHRVFFFFQSIDFLVSFWTFVSGGGEKKKADWKKAQIRVQQEEFVVRQLKWITFQNLHSSKATKAALALCRSRHAALYNVGSSQKATKWKLER